MVHFKSFSSFYDFVENLKRDGIQFKIIGHSYEDSTNIIIEEKPKSNIWKIKLVVLSAIGSFCLYESIKISDIDKVSDIKAKLATLPIIHGEVKFNDGIVSIK